MGSNSSTSDTLTDDERSKRNEILRTLLRSLEAHAAGEQRHADRVSVYATAAGHDLGLRGESLLNLRYAAALHDIGKLSVPSHLLKSSEPLSGEDRQRVNEHVRVRDILAEHRFLVESIPMIEAHHERWNGSGYPNRLEGMEIPFGARIIAAAEVFDVMLHGALWRPKFPEDVATAALSGLSGTWFEPGVVDALLRVHLLIQPPAS